MYICPIINLKTSQKDASIYKEVARDRLYDLLATTEMKRCQFLNMMKIQNTVINHTFTGTNHTFTGTNHIFTGELLATKTIHPCCCTCRMDMSICSSI